MKVNNFLVALTIGVVLFVLVLWKLFSVMDYGIGNSDRVEVADHETVNWECLHRVEITGHVLDFMVTHPVEEVQNFLATFKTPVEEKNDIAHQIAKNPEEIKSITSQMEGMSEEQKKEVVGQYMANYREFRELCE